MPTVILDRIPLPNLRLYTSISVLLVSCCLYYAIVTTNEPDWRLLNNMPLVKADSDSEEVPVPSTTGAAVVDAAVDKVVRSLQQPSGDEEHVQVEETSPVIEVIVASEPSVVDVSANTVEKDSVPVAEGVADNRGLTDQMRDVMSFMCQEPFCIWVSGIRLLYATDYFINKT